MKVTNSGKRIENSDGDTIEIRMNIDEPDTIDIVIEGKEWWMGVKEVSKFCEALTDLADNN